MALSTKELASTYCYELWNAADHIARCSKAAHVCAMEGDIAGAMEMLAMCERSANVFDMRWRDACDALAKADAEEAGR